MKNLSASLGRALVILLLAAALPALAQENPFGEPGKKPAAPAEKAAKAPAAPKVKDPKALAVLRKSFAFQSGLKTFSVLSQMMMKTPMGTSEKGQPLMMEMTMDLDLAVQRPNIFSFKTRGSGMMAMMAQDMVSDGKDLYVYSPSQNAYMIQPAPERIEQMAGSMSGSSGGPGAMILSALAADRPVEDAMKSISSAEYKGQEQEGGALCDHIRYTVEQEGFNVTSDVWIEAGETPVLRKLAPDLSNLSDIMGGLQDAAPGAGLTDAAEQVKKLDLAMAISYTNWKTNPQFPPDTFKFTPPPGATKMDSDPAQGQGQPEEKDLSGKPAPALKLPLLDGGEFDLAAQKGKKIVLLDFWATWCGPCRKAMPVMEKLAEEYKDKGVILVAVNLEEEPEKVREFLKKQNLHPAVALDAKNEAGTAFGAESIPLIVLIAKDGTIKAIERGFSDQLKSKLAASIDELLKI